MSHSLAMPTMHPSAEPPVPDKIPSQEIMPLPLSWAIHCHQSQENT